MSEIEQLREAIITACDEATDTFNYRLTQTLAAHLKSLRPKVSEAEYVPLCERCDMLRKKLGQTQGENENLTILLKELQNIIKDTEKVIEDRGVTEKDCNASLPQRVDNLIVAEKNSAYWEAIASQLKEDNEKLRDDLFMCSQDNEANKETIKKLRKSIQSIRINLKSALDETR